jgi:endonuclease V-like protein UPF0215 family
MPTGARISHVIGVDDAPVPSSDRARGKMTPVVATVYAGLRLEGVLSTSVERDGCDSTGALATVIGASRFAKHLHAVLLQGITLAGFNVVDIHHLSEALSVPVIVVVRRSPDLTAIERALRERVADGERKWALIERAGPVEPAGAVWIQRAGIDREPAQALVARLAVHGNIPEPLRAAHLIAGGITTGQSRGRT